MNIGYDAKRAFHNNTGLGHYSRTLINAMAGFYPQHEYFLFNPKASGFYRPGSGNIHTVLPERFLHKKFPSLWRSSWVKKDLLRLGIDLYHGLSHEIPIGIQNTGIRSVVTIHDLIHERYPEHYSAVDVKIYRSKFRYACAHADKIIAISKQTSDDLIQFYHADEKKISICYQSCNPRFAEKIPTDEKNRVRKLYGLPATFYLYVGSIIERKNLLNICRAMKMLAGKNKIPLVVIGDGGVYKQKIKSFIRKNNLEDVVIFLSENSIARKEPGFRNASDFPAIYQCALAMIYPSVFEGFGIPVLEALWSRIPVITSNVSCLPEAGGPGSILIDPLNVEAMADAMQRVQFDAVKRNEMIESGWEYANRFTNEKCAAAVMAVYRNLTG
jgi:glycosyltransferase involved in cell wall biosynthesis